MKITILVVGKVRGVLEEAVREFEARAGHYWKLDVIEVDAGVGRGGDVDESEVREAEAARLLDRIPEEAEVWALTRQGDLLSSVELARLLGNRRVDSAPGVAFVIGGAFGLDAELLRQSHRRLSLSKLTLPHAMARVFLGEQLYRAGTILRNEPYHKGGR